MYGARGQIDFRAMWNYPKTDRAETELPVRRVTNSIHRGTSMSEVHSTTSIPTSTTPNITSWLQHSPFSHYFLSSSAYKYGNTLSLPPVELESIAGPRVLQLCMLATKRGSLSSNSTTWSHGLLHAVFSAAMVGWIYLLILLMAVASGNYTTCQDTKRGARKSGISTWTLVLGRRFLIFGFLPTSWKYSW